MAIYQYDFWYDAQQRRFLEQLVSAFSGFYYEPGFRQGVQQPPRKVPCRYATRDRMVGYIQRNLSENALMAVPLITVFQTGLTGRRDGVQNLTLAEKIHVDEREVVNGQYTGNAGNSYTVTRLMPRPFKMNFQVDIWTSNLEQKYQLSEQILPVVFPYFDIQNSENGIDWSAKTMVEMDSNIEFSSRAFPIGTDDGIDILTLRGELDIWLNPPAKITNQKLIREVITNIYNGGVIDDCGLNAGALMQRIIVTPDDAQVYVDNGEVTLLNAKGGDFLADGTLPNFVDYLGQFGTYGSGISTIGVSTVFGGPYVVGTVTTDSANPNKLFWQIDPTTLPANTLPAIADIINPLQNVCSPNDSATLPTPVIGVRYLITADIGPGGSIWYGLTTTAYANDIIQYTSSGWTIVFTARNVKSQQYVLNNGNAKQLFWDGQEWLYAVEGRYSAGYWNTQVNEADVSSFNANVEESENSEDESEFSTIYNDDIEESGNAEDSDSD
jgi:hypothetical protein